jgi:predicted RNA-binding protein YlxR (DUF448 family)
VPRRRCVGCGRIAPKPELLRIVAVDQRSTGAGERARRVAVADRDATMPGRGAYLCRAGDPAGAAGLADPACLERATRRGGIPRALRSAVTLDPKLVELVKRVAQPAEGRPAGPLVLSKS